MWNELGLNRSFSAVIFIDGAVDSVAPVFSIPYSVFCILYSVFCILCSVFVSSIDVCKSLGHHPRRNLPNGFRVDFLTSQNCGRSALAAGEFSLGQRTD